MARALPGPGHRVSCCGHRLAARPDAKGPRARQGGGIVRSNCCCGGECASPALSPGDIRRDRSHRRLVLTGGEALRAESEHAVASAARLYGVLYWVCHSRPFEAGLPASVGAGPRAVASRRDHRSLLEAAGFIEIEEGDVTDEFPGHRRAVGPVLPTT